MKPFTHFGKPKTGSHYISGHHAEVDKRGRVFIQRHGVFGLGKKQYIQPGTLKIKLVR